MDDDDDDADEIWARPTVICGQTLQTVVVILRFVVYFC